MILKRSCGVRARAVIHGSHSCTACSPMSGLHCVPWRIIMKIVCLRASVRYGLYFALAAAGSGCMADQDPVTEASTTSAMVGVQCNKCVGPVGGSTDVGVQLEIETCTGTANQRFRPEAMGGGFF